MTIKPTVLVLAEGDDPQLSMLKDLPHIVGRKPEDFTSVVNAPVVILAWSGPKQLLREVFLMCRNILWVHSRSAGLDSLLFPELVSSNVPLTNGSGVFSLSLGEFALAAILYFAKDFRRMVRNQMAGVWEQFDVDEIDTQTVGIVGYGDIGRAVAKRVHPMGMSVLALKRHPPEEADPLVDQLLSARWFIGDALALRLRRGHPAPHRGDPPHDQRQGVRCHEANRGDHQCGAGTGH